VEKTEPAVSFSPVHDRFQRSPFCHEEIEDMNLRIEQIPSESLSNADEFPRGTPRWRFGWQCLMYLMCLWATGCTAILSPVSGVPAHRLPAQFRPKPKNNLVPVELSRLRQIAPKEYAVDADDILGIYIEGVLGDSGGTPPVHFPERGSDLPPSIGFPIPVRDDGSLPLPFVSSIQVSGLTLRQVESEIRNAYTEQKILKEGKDRILVSLIRKRTYSIVVMRQDGATAALRDGRAQMSTQGYDIELPAYKNSVLNALAMTGGLPGLDAKNEILIYKLSRLDQDRRDQFIRDFYSTPLGDDCLCRPKLPDDPAIIRIPLRLPEGEIPKFKPEDIVLEDGDIVYIQSREREVFYTGGLLPGGEFPLPRDYDLDVLGALAITGQGVASAAGGRGGGGGGFGGFGASSVIPPGQLFILRKTPCDGQITIAVDLNRAVRDPAARPLIQPGDTLILQYKPQEEVANFSITTFFTFLISDLLRNNSTR
jgi:protein involved in polysaccharide export with SLBB domain